MLRTATETLGRPLSAGSGVLANVLRWFESATKLSTICLLDDFDEPLFAARANGNDDLVEIVLDEIMGALKMERVCANLVVHVYYLTNATKGCIHWYGKDICHGLLFGAAC